MVLVSSIYAIASKNPETRYQPMRDDRGSFIKSQSALTTELDALGATARQEGKAPYPNQAKEIDDETSSSDSLSRPATQPNVPLSNTHLPAGQHVYTGAPAPSSPMSPYPPQTQQGASRPNTAPGSPVTKSFSRPGAGAPYPPRSAHSNYPPQANYPPQNFNRPQQNQRPPQPQWQTGAGYD